MRRINCEYFDSDGKKLYARAYFGEDTFVGDTGNKYRLNGFVANGGNGAVFICYSAESNRKLAVKFLRVLDRVRRDRFEFECLVLSDLIHENILPLIDTGFVEVNVSSSIPFMVTSFFSTNIENRIKKDGLFSISDIKKYGKQMCAAFDYLHSHGVVHRDIKPGNFLIEEDSIVISDFGLAKTYTEEGEGRFWRSDMTASDERVGSIPWMSPELFRYWRDKTAVVDSRSDIYQLGRVLWYMHTGDVAVLPDREEDRSGGKLFDILITATHKKPEKRFQSAIELQQALEAM